VIFFEKITTLEKKLAKVHLVSWSDRCLFLKKKRNRVHLLIFSSSKIAILRAHLVR
jgi:hypothetical protein